MIEKIFAAPVEMGSIGGQGFGAINENLSAITSDTSGGAAMGMVTFILSRVIGFLTIAGGIWFLVQITLAGISWITAGGEKNKLTEAREKLTNSFIGLTVVVAGWAILALASLFFGIDFTSPSTIVGNLIMH